MSSRDVPKVAWTFLCPFAELTGWSGRERKQQARRVREGAECAERALVCTGHTAGCPGAALSRGDTATAQAPGIPLLHRVNPALPLPWVLSAQAPFQAVQSFPHCLPHQTSGFLHQPCLLIKFFPEAAGVNKTHQGWRPGPQAHLTRAALTWSPENNEVPRVLSPVLSAGGRADKHCLGPQGGQNI